MTLAHHMPQRLVAVVVFVVVVAVSSTLFAHNDAVPTVWERSSSTSATATIATDDMSTASLRILYMHFCWAKSGLRGSYSAIKTLTSIVHSTMLYYDVCISLANSLWATHPPPRLAPSSTDQ